MSSRCREEKFIIHLARKAVLFCLFVSFFMRLQVDITVAHGVNTNKRDHYSCKSKSQMDGRFTNMLTTMQEEGLRLAKQ